MKQQTKIEKETPRILNEFLEYLRTIKNYSKNTIDGYKLDLMQFFNFINEYHHFNIHLKDFNIFILLRVQESDVIAFLVYLNYFKDSSVMTRQRKLTAIRRFYKWLINLHPGCIKVNPTINIHNIKKVERLPKYIPLRKSKELQSIFNITNSRYPQRNNAILCLFLNSGIRLNELINIKISDINFKQNTIKVRGKGNIERTIYFNELCTKKIKEYLKFRERKGEVLDINNFLFLNNKHKQLGTDGIEYICNKAYKLADLEEYGYTIHTLRHTAATILYRYVTQDLLVLKEFIGHKHITTTQIYTHVYNKQLIDAINRHPLILINDEEKNSIPKIA